MNLREKFGIRAQHVGIHVSSYKETYEWYHKVFGFEEGPHTGAENIKGGVFPKMRMMSLGDFMIEVYEVQNARPYNLVDFEWSLGIKHLNFAVKNFKELVAYLRTLPDVTFVVENDYSETESTLYILDNNGFLVEVTPDHY